MVSSVLSMCRKFIQSPDKSGFVTVLVEYMEFMQAKVQLKDMVLLCH